MLGYAFGEVLSTTYPGATGTIWLDDVRCTGEETTLADCPRGGWGSHNCLHSEDVSVRCYNEAQGTPGM